MEDGFALFGAGKVSERSSTDSRPEWMRPYISRKNGVQHFVRYIVAVYGECNSRTGVHLILELI